MWMQQGLALCRAMDFQLGDWLTLETLHQQQVAGRHAFTQLSQARLGLLPLLVQQGPALPPGQQYLAGASLAMSPAILSRLIKIKIVMSVLD
jgi:hypothetical protein